MCLATREDPDHRVDGVAAQGGFEPPIGRLTAACLAAWLPCNRLVGPEGIAPSPRGVRARRATTTLRTSARSEREDSNLRSPVLWSRCLPFKHARSEREDSNLRSPVPETGAFAKLSYAQKRTASRRASRQLEGVSYTPFKLIIESRRLPSAMKSWMVRAKVAPSRPINGR